MFYREMMPVVLRCGGRSLVVALCLTAGSCTLLPTADRSRSQSQSRTEAEDIQIEIMAFADSYTAIVSQAIDQVAEQMPEHRGALYEARLRHVQNAITIAASQNPMGGLLDMTVMVTLQRQVAEDYWIPERLGEAGQPIVDALVLLEQEIWLITDRVLDDEQAETLRALIPQILERYRGRVLVSSLRASDFVEDRRTAVTRLKGGTSLLTLFQLDPLSGLSPAALELARSRLLAERVFFWAKRSPLILNWQVQDVILDALGESETQQVVEASTRLAESSERLSSAVEQLSHQLPEERTAAITQMYELVDEERDAAFEQFAALAAAEREAALNQAFEGIATEREAILRTFEQEDVRLRGLLEDLRGTIESSTALSASLTTTVESTDKLLARFSQSSDEPRAEEHPFDIAEYKATAEAITTTVEELDDLIVSVTEFMTSPAWEEGNSRLEAATDRAQTTLEAMIDRGYRRSLLLMSFLIVGGFVAALLYRIICARLIGSRIGRAS